MTSAVSTDPDLAALAGSLTTIAVTGTNGKTSTTGMIASIVRAAGEPAARITTLGMWVGDEQLAEDTSLASFVRTVRRAREVGARTLALEVTSRALAAGFAERWPADVAVFTNLTHDHLDRHGTPEHYLAAKAQLFVRLREGGVAVLNAADPAAALLAEVVPAHARAVGFLPSGRYVRAAGDGAEAAPASEEAASGGPPGLALALELVARSTRSDTHGVRLELAPSPLAAALGGVLSLGAPGAFLADNALAAALAAAHAGYPPDAISRGLAQYAGTPGRFEVCSREPLVVVDYAHSPDALARVLESARALVPAGGRLGCVFGCGGERDRAKRAGMGELADRLADVVWLTTDNPRGEPAAAIAAMVRAGARGRATWHDVPDRRAAITTAIHWAIAQDVVIIAGRGHETHQQLGPAGAIALRDASVVAEALRCARSGAHPLLSSGGDTQ